MLTSEQLIKLTEQEKLYDTMSQEDLLNVKTALYEDEKELNNKYRDIKDKFERIQLRSQMEFVEQLYYIVEKKIDWSKLK